GTGRSLFPENGDERWDALSRAGIGAALMDNLVSWRRELARPDDAISKVMREGYLAKLQSALHAMETVSRSEGRFDIGDLTIAVALSYVDFRFREIDWRAKAPGLAAWYSAVRQRASMKATEFEG